MTRNRASVWVTVLLSLAVMLSAVLWVRLAMGRPLYLVAEPPAAARPVYRFWSRLSGSHFFTIDPNEWEYVMEHYSDVWIYEGIAFYACPP